MAVMLTALLSAADCEAIRSGWPDQPVNAWSSLGFVAVGAVLVIRGRVPHARLAGAVATLVGIGSVLFHGGHNSFTGWVHDWSIASLLVVLLMPERDGRRHLNAAIGAMALMATIDVLLLGITLASITVGTAAVLVLGMAMRRASRSLSGGRPMA